MQIVRAAVLSSAVVVSVGCVDTPTAPDLVEQEQALVLPPSWIEATTITLPNGDAADV